MSTSTDRVRELDLEMVHLLEEVERYRSAAEDALQQLDWCIGYFTGSRKGTIAQALSDNRAPIRGHYLGRAEQSRPPAQGES